MAVGVGEDVGDWGVGVFVAVGWEVDVGLEVGVIVVLMPIDVSVATFFVGVGDVFLSGERFLTMREGVGVGEASVLFFTLLARMVKTQASMMIKRTPPITEDVTRFSEI